MCLYERGDRIPRVDTLERLLAAAGSTLALRAHPAPPVDVAAQARDLVAVLDLADHLPQRHDAELAFPPFRTLATR